MKKFFILAFVLVFAFTGTAVAEDRLALSGQYRMEMYTLNDNDFDSSVKDDQQYIDQRFRLQFDITPADGVKAILRGDFAEDTWGTIDTGAFTAPTTTISGIGYRANAQDSGTIMIDKAYVDLQTAMVNWQVGLFGHAGFGKGITTDNQGVNIMVTADFAPVTVWGLWTKVEEGTALTDDASATAADEDRDIYGLQVAYKADAFGLGAFYAMDDDKNANTSGSTATVLGLYADATFGMFTMWAEYDMFGGDNGAGTDFVGTNLTVEVAAALSDQLTVGLDLIYAAGNEEATDTQIAFLTTDSAWNPFEHGPFAAIGPSTGLVHGHEPFEDSTGSKSFNLFATFVPMEALTIWANYGYLTPDVDDPNNDGSYIDSASVMGLAARYTFLPGTSFSVKYRNVGRSATGGVLPDDSETLYAGMLAVNF